MRPHLEFCCTGRRAMVAETLRTERARTRHDAVAMEVLAYMAKNEGITKADWLTVGNRADHAWPHIDKRQTRGDRAASGSVRPEGLVLHLTPARSSQNCALRAWRSHPRGRAGRSFGSRTPRVRVRTMQILEKANLTDAAIAQVGDQRDV